jgi:hypothetical protein
MNYWTNIFSPATYEAFLRSDRSVSGFRESQREMARRVCPGDKLLCYIVYLSRWFGVLEVLEGPYEDRTPLFVPDNDPFIIRFKVRTTVCLPLEQAVPIHDREVYSRLTFTRDVPPGGYWLGPLRRSLQRVAKEDGEFLCALLESQQRQPRTFPVDPAEYERSLKRRVERPDRSVLVSVPEDRGDDEDEMDKVEPDRESPRIQAALCRIGEAMGFAIWIPPADRSRVLEYWSPQPGVLLERLPLNYDETTLGTVQRIDVLWLKGRAIRRAFEVEHTTSIYSGLLRMADLCALLPNINISLHIVAPDARRDKVLREITRPVFSLLEGAPLLERCTYLSYSSVGEILKWEYLSHTTDSVLDEFAEYAE